MRSRPTSGSSASAQNRRICGSSAFIFFGVNTRESRPRCIVCWGGSSKMNTPGGIGMSFFMTSSTDPRPEMNVSRSVSPRSTSSNRLTAKKS